jgi:hypothetical protein
MTITHDFYRLCLIVRIDGPSIAGAGLKIGGAGQNQERSVPLLFGLQ